MKFVLNEVLRSEPRNFVCLLLQDWGALKNRGNLNVQDFLDAMGQFTATVNGANDNMGNLNE